MLEVISQVVLLAINEDRFAQKHYFSLLRRQMPRDTLSGGVEFILV